MKKIFRFLKNILFPKVYAPWEDPINGSNLTHDKFPYGKPQTDEVARGSGTESMAVRD